MTPLLEPLLLLCFGGPLDVHLLAMPLSKLVLRHAGGRMSHLLPLALLQALPLPLHAGFGVATVRLFPLQLRPLHLGMMACDFLLLGSGGPDVGAARRYLRAIDLDRLIGRVAPLLYGSRAIDHGLSLDCLAGGPPDRSGIEPALRRTVAQTAVPRNVPGLLKETLVAGRR